jgi:hypothetical protein
LEVDLSTVGKRLKALGMIQKEGNWVPYELKPRDIERRFMTCDCDCLHGTKEKVFYIVLLLAMKNGYITTIRNAEDHGLSPDNHHHQWQNAIFMDLSSSFVFGGINKVWFIMNC